MRAFVRTVVLLLAAAVAATMVISAQAGPKPPPSPPPPAKSLTFTPESYDFGPVAVGESATYDFTLSYTGKGKSGRIHVTLTPKSTRTFTAPFTISVNGCRGKTLTAATTCTVTVAYTPQVDGATDTATLKANAGKLHSNSVALSGESGAGANVAPTVDPQTGDAAVTVEENSTDNLITLTGHDPDGDQINFGLDGLPEHGTLGGYTDFTLIPADCSGDPSTCTADLTYTPTEDWFGDDSLVFYAWDEHGDFSELVTVSITVTRFDAQPTADGRSFSTNLSGGTITLTGSDADGEELTFAIVDSPSRADLDISAIDAVDCTTDAEGASTCSAEVGYDPKSSGTDSFTFTTDDGYGPSEPATVSITVANHAPSALAPDPVPVATAGDLKTITLSGTDDDGDALDFVIDSGPSHGVLYPAESQGGDCTGLASPDGSNCTADFAYIPNGDFTGSDYVTFHVSDGDLTSGAPVSVTITVTGGEPCTDTGAGHIYWTADNMIGHIGRAGLDGTCVTPAFINVTGHPEQLAVDDTYIYWPTDYSIGRAKLDGTGVEPSFITGVYQPYGLAIDGNYVYWANWNGSIGRADLDGTDVDQDFISEEDLDTYSVTSLAVDANYIYWTTYDDDVIGRADLDGTDVQLEFITGADVSIGLAVDADHIYWSNHHANGGTGSIGRADLDGTNVDQDFIGDVTSPTGVAVDGTYIYWVDNGWGDGMGTIGRANLNDGSEPDPDFITGENAQFGLAVSPAPAPTCQGMSEGFAGETFPPTDWVRQNNSSPLGGLGWLWEFDYSTPHFAEITPGAATSSSTTAVASAWLLTPPLLLENGATFSFYTKSLWTSRPDRLQVRLSTNDTSSDVGTTESSVGDFTVLLDDINSDYSAPDGYPVTWTQKSYTLSGISTPTVGRLAFRYYIVDTLNHGNRLDIDNVSYACAT